MSDAEIKLRGFELLSQNMGLVDAERFICLIQRERFDYTKWQPAMRAAERQLLAGNPSRCSKVETSPVLRECGLQWRGDG